MPSFTLADYEPFISHGSAHRPRLGNGKEMAGMSARALDKHCLKHVGQSCL